MVSRPSYERNTSGLASHAQKKAQETRQRVSDAIDRLLDEKKTVNFNTVALAASVTKAYLYRQADIRDRIDALRLHQGQERLRLIANGDGRSLSDRGKDVLLAAKDRRIKELEAENRGLKEEIKKLHGKLYERL